MIYICSFILASFLLDQSTKCQKKNTWLFVSMAVMITVLLAAFRDSSVGIDVRVYAEYITGLAQRHSFSDFLVQASQIGVERGYAAITYIAATCLGGLPGVLGATQFVVILFAFLRIRDFKGVVPIWVATLIYLLMFYNQSLNIMRQSMAMSVVFWGSRYIGKHNWKYIIVVLLAMLLHISAFLGFFILALDVASKGRLGCWKSIFTVTGLLMFLVFYSNIMETMIPIVFGENSKYLTYLSSESGHFSKLKQLYAVCCTVIVCISSCRISDVRCDVGSAKNTVYIDQTVEAQRFYLLLAICGFILGLLTIYDGDNYRFALYCTMFLPVSLPQFRNCFTTKIRLLVDCAIVLMAAVYWLYVFVLHNEAGTFPYAFNLELW